MLSAKLYPNSFVRVLNGIAVVYNIDSRRQDVFDASGAQFLKQLTRTSRTEEQIINSLSDVFTGVSRDELAADFREFAIHLHQHGFIQLDGVDVDEEVSPKLLPGNMPAIDRGTAETSQFLKDYFNINPTIFSFQFYLTEDCNEHCVHCYVDKTHKPTLPVSRQLEIIDELQQLGTLDITFTGGEALLRKDLHLFIERARKNDLIISLLSNLTLLSDETIEFLKGGNIGVVQTSVYSMDPQVHDSITRQPGSHRKTLQSIERLQAANIPVSIGCPVMRQNHDSFHEVVRYGNAAGIPVACDVAIMARENGNTSNLVHRIDEEDLEGVVRRIVDTSERYREYLRQTPVEKDDTTLEGCGIGNYMLCLKTTGEFLPCPGFGLVVGSAWNSTVQEVWRHSEQLRELRSFNRKDTFPQCYECEASVNCNFCLAKFHNEVNWQAGLIPSGYCAAAHANRRVALTYLQSAQ